MRTILTAVLLVSLAGTSFGQKIKSDGYKISFTSIKKNEMEMFGETQTVYSGTLKVKAKDGQSGSYVFYLPMIKGKYSHLTIRNVQGEIMDPRIYYDAESKSFRFYVGTENETSEKVKSDKSLEDIVLSGMLIWLKIEK